MSDIQRDIDLVDEAMHTTQPWSRSDWAAAVEAWQRISEPEHCPCGDEGCEIYSAPWKRARKAIDAARKA